MTVVQEIRMAVAETMLGWVISIMPKGTHNAEFCAAVIPWLERQLRRHAVLVTDPVESHVWRKARMLAARSLPEDNQ